MTRRLLILAFLMALVAVPVAAQPNVLTAYPIVRAPSMTVAAVPLAFTAAQKIANGGQQVNQCIGRVETDQVRIGVLGILTPSATAGQLVNVGDMITVSGYDNIDRFLVIKVTNTATIKWFCTAATR